jgi:hypothetical protein
MELGTGTCRDRCGARLQSRCPEEATVAPHTWTVEIAFTEDADRTRADAMLMVGETPLHGWGRSRRNPSDPDVPKIGEEIAAARALADLSRHLLHEAAEIIEQHEGRPVAVHG